MKLLLRMVLTPVLGVIGIAAIFVFCYSVGYIGLWFARPYISINEDLNYGVYAASGLLIIVTVFTVSMMGTFVAYVFEDTFEELSYRIYRYKLNRRLKNAKEKETNKKAENR